jgi:hypothetical protein
MAAVKSLCNTSLIIKNGTVDFYGTTEEGISNYIRESTTKNELALASRTDREGNGKFRFEDIELKNEKSETTDTFFCNEKATIKIRFANDKLDLSKVIITVGIKDLYNELIAFFTSDEMGFTLNNNTREFTLEIPHLALRPGNYSVWLFASYQTTAPSDFCDVIDAAAHLTILPVDFWATGKMIRSRNTAFFNGTFIQ